MKDAHPRQRTGSFKRLDHDHDVTRWNDGFRVTNGLAFSPDCRRMWLAETRAGEQAIGVSEHDPEYGVPGPAGLYFDTRMVAVRPDGSTIDAAG